MAPSEFGEKMQMYRITQKTFKFMEELIAPADLRHNKLRDEDRAFHDWYRFVLSYPPHLVRDYFSRFELRAGDSILDPFCGTGTTLVEAKKNGLASFGVEAHPMACFASRVKTNWLVEPRKLVEHAKRVFEQASCALRKSNGELRTLPPEQGHLLLSECISPVPLHKCLVLRDEILTASDSPVRDAELLALAFISVFVASNLKFGPEVGVGRERKLDAPVLDVWLSKIKEMAADIREFSSLAFVSSRCLNADARGMPADLPPAVIDAVITSPPYPNEKDYTRTTRLESVLLGFVKSKQELRALKQSLVRSNTRNVYVSDDDDLAIAQNGRITAIANEIERRRVALGKDSGFERLYHRVTRLYFGGMKRHFEQLKRVLKPGAKLAYVVGDQASYLQVLIRTGELLADIADEVGYEVLSLDLFRTRLSTATGDQLREEVLVLEWPGEKKMPQKDDRSRYDQLIERVFFDHYEEGVNEVYFDREEFAATANKLGIGLPKNLGDIIYSYRYRIPLPERIRALLPEGEEWVIRSVGRGKYVFAKCPVHEVRPNPKLSRIKVLDSTPEIVQRYALSDEQALLAILRYNKLMEVFTGVACYSLQNHLRTFVQNVGQVETDEIYIGVSKTGEQFVFPVQAKGARDHIGTVQIEQDLAVCKSKFPSLTCRPIAAQFIESDLIALFEFDVIEGQISIKEERHYWIVPNEALSDEEIADYRSTQDET
jgi:DNA modification methylase